MNEYRVIESEQGLWTVGFKVPQTGAWETDSDHDTRESAGRRRNWLNGTLHRGLVYRQTEPGLWTVGYFNGRTGAWCPDEDFGSRLTAARSVAQGNGTKLWEYPEWQGPVARIQGEA